jgi:AcrR family transcriptional regulator
VTETVELASADALLPSLPPLARVGAMSEEKPKRAYRMRVRAESAAATRERILDAAGDSFSQEKPSLERIAKQAGTTVQTVLRHFGSRDGLIDALLDRANDVVRRERMVVAPGDVRGAVANLVRHYERYGSFVMRLLAEEHHGLVRKATDRGRLLHHEWVQSTFEPYLRELDPPRRRVREAQLVAVCDVYVWKLMRKDMGLSAADTEAAIVGLIEGR